VRSNSARRVGELWLDQGRRDAGWRARGGGAQAASASPGERRAWIGQPRRHHQGAWPGCRPRRPGPARLDTLLDGIEGPPLLLLLDEVRTSQPGRLSAQRGRRRVHAVIARRQGRRLTPVVCKVASGPRDRAYIQVTNLARTMDQIKERGSGSSAPPGRRSRNSMTGT